MVVRRVRAVGLVSIVVMLLLGAELAGSPSAHAAQCIQPSPGGGELLVDFDATNEAVEIATDGFGFYYVTADSLLLCSDPISRVTSIHVVHSSGTGQILALGQAPGNPWTLTGGITVDSGPDRVQLLWELTAPGAISIAAPVDACNSTTTLTSGTSITIGGPIDTAPHVPGACDPGTEDFVLVAPSVSVTGAIGATRPIDSLTIDSQTSRASIGGSVTTIGTQAYNGQGLSISGSRTLTASSVTAAGGIDGAASSSLTISQSGDSQITGQITGGLALTKAGTGTLTLYAANTYTGTTTVSAGTLDVINNDGLGATSAGTSVAAGATLRLRAAIFPWDAISLASTATLQSTGTLTNVLNGQLTTTGTPTIDIADTATLVLAGGVAGGGFQKTGTGTLAISDSATNTGAITVSAGLLRVTGPADALGTTAGGTTVASGGALELAGSGTVAEPLTISGTGISSGGALRSATSAQTLSGALTLGAAATISTTTALTASGGITGGALLTKAGAAKLTLSGASGSFSGGTRIAAGTVEVSASTGLGTGPIAIADGSTLAVAGVTLPSGNAISTTGTGTAQITSTGSAQLSGAITLGAPLRLAPAAASNLFTTGLINGAQDLSVDNATGATTTFAAAVGSTTPLASVTATGSGTTRTNGDVATAGGQSYAGTLTIGADLRLAASELTGAATVASDGPTRTLTVEVSADFGTNYSGTLQSNVALVKTGTGALGLSGSSASAAPMTISGGTLRIAAGGVAPAVTIDNGTLTGSGTTGAVTRTANGGSLSVATPSRLTTGSIGGTGVMFDFGTLNPGTAGTAYGQLRVVGTVDLTDGIYYVNQGQTQPGDAFTVIDNDGSDPVVGTFLGLAEGGAPMSWPGWTISYRGGDGNDVVITRTPTPGSGGSNTGSGDAGAGGTTGTAGPTAPTPSAAARTTTIRAATAKRRVVTAVVDAAGPGVARVTVTGKGAKRCTATRRAAAAGAITLRCRVKGRGRAVKVVTRFTPTGAAAVTRTDRLRLR